MDFNSVLIQLTVTLLASGCGTWIAAWFAFTRYRKEKVWERKEASYREVIEALNETDEWIRSSYSALSRDTDLPREAKERLGAQAKASTAKIRKAINCGGLLLRAEAVTRLREYRAAMDGFDRSADFQSYLAKLDDETSACLADVVKIARAELGIC
jgi:hypothetical protein